MFHSWDSLRLLVCDTGLYLEQNDISFITVAICGGYISKYPRLFKQLAQMKRRQRMQLIRHMGFILQIVYYIHVFYSAYRSTTNLCQVTKAALPIRCKAPFPNKDRLSRRRDFHYNHKRRSWDARFNFIMQWESPYCRNVFFFNIETVSMSHILMNSSVIELVKHLGPFSRHVLTLIPARVSDCIHY